MPLVTAVDYPNKLIFLGPDSVGVTVLPIDIYTEMRERRRLNADNDRSFFPMVTAFGNESIGGGSSTPRYTNLAAGVRIVPFDTDHSLLIRGNLISTDEGLAGRDLFDRSSLTSEVDIDYQPPQVEIITVATGGALTATQDARLEELHRMRGLDPAQPVTVTETEETAGDITLDITGDGETTSTLTRQP